MYGTVILETFMYTHDYTGEPESVTVSGLKNARESAKRDNISSQKKEKNFL